MKLFDCVHAWLIGYAMAITVVLLTPDMAAAAETRIIEADKQFSFAEVLLAEGDYYRAISEYKRFVYFFPENKLVETCNYRIGECYYRAKRWQEAREAFTTFIKQYPVSPLIPGALYLKGMAEKQLRRYTDALSTFERVIKSTSSEFADKAVYQSAIIYIEMEDWQKARETFSLVPKDSQLSESASIMASELLHIDDLPKKSPVTAGTLAAILPGAGHLYTERPTDALVAFLLNGAFIFGAIELFSHENYIAGGIVTFFELGWYTGNIYSAVSSAHKYNKKTRDDFIEHLKEISSVSFWHDPGTSSNYLMFSFQF
ncbi:MAG TPA: tetratricopeptide repeat protein [Syntrophales bacterium]